VIKAKMKKMNGLMNLNLCLIFTLAAFAGQTLSNLLTVNPWGA